MKEIENMETDSRTQLKVQVLLAEYERIKDEIFHHKTTLQTILNFIIILGAAQLGILGQIFLSSSMPQSLIEKLLLITPIPFALLSLYHSGYIIRIHKLASYMDGELRSKIEAIVGEGTLRTHSFYPISNILALRKSSIDGRITYLALFGLKILPQMLPLIIFFCIKALPWGILEYVWFACDFLLMIVSVVGQHD